MIRLSRVIRVLLTLPWLRGEGLKPRHNLLGLSGSDLGTERHVTLVDQHVSHYIVVLIGAGKRRDQISQDVIRPFCSIDAAILRTELVIFGRGVFGAVDDLIVVIDVAFAYDHLAAYRPIPDIKQPFAAPVNIDRIVRLQLLGQVLVGQNYVFRADDQNAMVQRLQRVKDSIQISDLMPAEPVQVLPLSQKRETVWIFGGAWIGRAKKFERQSSDEEDERVVEFSHTCLNLRLVSTNADQVNLVRIEVPIRDFDGVGGLSVFI